MRTKPTTRRRNYGERILQDQRLADWIAEKPRRGQLIAIAQHKDQQRAFAARVRKGR